MKKVLLPALLLLSSVCLYAQDEDITTVTLPQIGAGPALLIFVSEYGGDSAFPDLPGVLNDKPPMLNTVRKLGFEDVTVLENPGRDEMKRAMSDVLRCRTETRVGDRYDYDGFRCVLEAGNP